MAGLVPAISLSKARSCHTDRDRRDKPGDDGESESIWSGTAFSANYSAAIAGAASGSRWRSFGATSRMNSSIERARFSRVA